MAGAWSIANASSHESFEAFRFALLAFEVLNRAIHITDRVIVNCYNSHRLVLVLKDG